MSLLVTGSIGIDTVTSPHGHVEGVLGGTAVYFSFAATQFTPVRLVGVVGEDFPPEYRSILESRHIDLAGLEVRNGSKTFRWTGNYEGSMNQAQTLDVALNVLSEDAPHVPASFADSEVVFLANSHPTLQRALLSHVDAPELVVCDTMDLWIDNERESLLETFAVVNGVILNDGEAIRLTGLNNLLEAGDTIREMGPAFVIIKKGEHGALLISEDAPVAIPAYPTKLVRDPTGAGDSFAGGVLGYVAQQRDYSPAGLRRAMVRGTVTASFAIEDFSLRRVQHLKSEEVAQRVNEFIGMLRFD